MSEDKYTTPDKVKLDGNQIADVIYDERLHGVIGAVECRIVVAQSAPHCELYMPHPHSQSHPMNG